jgi:DNA excision repair protein ERCC-2
MTEWDKKVHDFFPYAEVRPFQDDFIKTVFDAVDERKSAVIEGTNGLGKTVAALCACLPLALERNLKILYVARTHRQHERVVEELKRISGKQKVSGVSVRGRHEMCLHRFVRKNARDARAVMEICEMLKAKKRCRYYRNIEEKESQYLGVKKRISIHPCTAAEIQVICQRKGFCPYELVKTLLADINVVALSYLYVFDPAIRTAFLKSLDLPLKKAILIVDEAHNLPETAIEVASSALTLFTIRQAEIEAREFGDKEVATFAKTVRCEIESIAEKAQRESLLSSESLVEVIKRKAGVKNPEAFFKLLYDKGNSIRKSLLEDGKYPRSFIHRLGEFLLRWLETSSEPSFLNLLSKYKSRRGVDTAKLEIVALDPSVVTEPVFSKVYSNIVISGTLQPLEAYVQITKLPENTIRKVVPSPFPREHVLPLVCRGITTAMEERTSQMYRVIVDRICEVVQNTPCNTGVFAASFRVLDGLMASGLKEALRKPLFHEKRGMSSRENGEVVAEFKALAHNGGAVLLGVQGGRSSEGVDFPGDQMNSVVVVGVPYAEPTPRINAQISYFERHFPGCGRDYGYVIPAMKKASQAAGRPIRNLEDRAAVIFLDYRFSTYYCQRFLPLWIRQNLKVLPNDDGSIARELGSFFKRVC